MSNNKIPQLTDAQFEQDIIASKDLVLIDFYADWCGPCKVITPLLEELSSEYADKIKFYKLDVDNNQQTPAKYGVRGIPTLIIFGNGTVKDSLVGAVGKDKLQQFIEKNL